jgi:gas vesicle protein
MREDETPMSKGKYFMAGAVIGGLIGAATALLATTKTGNEIRKELGKGLELAKERGKELYLTIKSQAPVESKWEKVNDEGTVLVNRYIDAPSSKTPDYISIEDKK